MASRLRGAAVLVCVTLCACGDDAGPPADETGSTSGPGSSSAEAASATSPTTTAPGTTTDDGTTTTSTTTSGESETTGSSGSGSSDSGSSTGDESTTGTADCRLLIVEALYDATGPTDNDLQWVKLYNPCEDDRALDGFALGWGGADYTDTMELAGDVDAGECFLVGGPMSTADNAFPNFQQFEDFAPGIDLAAKGVGGGVALFDVAADQVEADTVPIDAVVYGPNNNAGLIDESGVAVPSPHVDNHEPGGSIRRTDAGPSWETTGTPSPNDCPPF